MEDATKLGLGLRAACAQHPQERGQKLLGSSGQCAAMAGAGKGRWVQALPVDRVDLGLALSLPPFPPPPLS